MTRTEARKQIATIAQQVGLMAILVEPQAHDRLTDHLACDMGAPDDLSECSVCGSLVSTGYVWSVDNDGTAICGHCGEHA